MTPKVAGFLIAAGLSAWGILFAATGIVPWGALPFVAGIGLACLCITALLVWGTKE